MLLALNTATPQFSVALIKMDGSVLAEYFMSSGSKGFRYFMGGIHFLLETSGVDAQEIRAIIVTRGPGGFTGLRVGLSAAKGMARGLHIPIIGVSSLEAMASQSFYTPYPICVVISSRGEEVFTGLFRWSNGDTIIRLREDSAMKIEGLTSLIEGKTLFLGNDYKVQGQLLKEILGQNALLAPAHLWNPKASATGAIGLRRFLRNDFDDLRDLVPSYLRSPHIRPNPFPLISEEPGGC
jgi:tRNA threonylcarbamoyladenosine biosynthesis protein TsaB